MTEERPEIALDLRAAARHLVENPVVLDEREPSMFRLIRRHCQQLDRWFTQRFGYRLQQSADTARLFKSTVVASQRPLRTVGSQSHAFSQREYTMLALALASVVAGPNVVSLRDLIHEIRAAAVDAGTVLGDSPSERRALVTVLKWMIDWGLVSEMHESVDSYASDGSADAVLKVRPDRVSMVPLPVLSRSETPAQLLDRSYQRPSPRTWMRSMLLEEPVVYRTDLSESEWSELRRRLGAETDIFEEMFGLRIEARAEGVAAIDPDNGLTDSRFPATGTVPQAALLLIDRLVDLDENPLGYDTVVEQVAELAREHRRHWSKVADDPKQLTDKAVELLFEHRLAERADDGIRLLPAAWRYGADVRIEQMSLL